MRKEMTFNHYGDKANPQVRHLSSIHPDTHIEVFPGMNHGQLLIDHPEEVAKRMIALNRR